MIMGDQKSLFRAFKAVIDNAIKFSPDGGLVRIEVGWNQSQRMGQNSGSWGGDSCGGNGADI